MDILLIIILISLLIILQRKIYTVKCFKGLSFKIKFENDGIFEGDKVKLIQQITNGKLLPVLWLKVQFLVSRNLIFEEMKERTSDFTYYKKNIYSLMPYEKITKQFNIIASKRGYYIINEINLSCGDLFLRSNYIKNIRENKILYVYPKLIASEQFNVKFEKITGEIITKRHVIEDPFQLRGIRDYTNFDSMRAVNWKATARTGELKVNQYDFTSSQEILILLNFDKYNKWDSEILFEQIIRLGASFVNPYLNLGITISLSSNGSDILSGEEINVQSTAGIGCAAGFYEKLARINVNNKSRDFKDIITEKIGLGVKKPLWIIISHYVGKELREQIDIAKGLGFSVQWIIPKFVNERLDIVEDQNTTFWEVNSLEG